MFENRINQQMTKGLQQIATCLQMQRAYQLQRLILSLNGKPTNHMLLATDIVDVQNKSVQTPAVTTSRDTQRIFLLREDNSLECNLNRFWEVEPVEQSSMTAE